MERDGLVTRTVYPVVSHKGEYTLTPLGTSLGAASCGVCHWAADQLHTVARVRHAFEARTMRVGDIRPLLPARTSIPHSRATTMSASVRTLFGAAPASEPATPGSYGERPRNFRLPDASRLGPVRLQVAELDRALAFYQGTLGFALLARDGADATLTAHGSDRPLVVLHANPGARSMAPRGRLGLFHVAILLPDRAALGRFVRHLADVGVRAGAADHLVSEAFYLTDPDGLGIEVYADRPRSAWRRTGRELMMATDPIDVPALMIAAGDAPWTGLPAGTAIGHVHLHVGDLARAAAFYAEALGLDRTVWRYPGALFLAAGGYHHHVGANTWAGAGAVPPAPDDAQLLEWTLEVPNVTDLEAMAANLDRSGVAAEREADGVLTAADPWGTRVRVRAPQADRISPDETLALQPWAPRA